MQEVQVSKLEHNHNAKLTWADGHWLLHSTLLATNPVRTSTVVNLQIARSRQQHVHITSWIHCLGCDQSWNKVNSMAGSSVQNARPMLESTRGRACSVAAVNGSYLASALQRAELMRSSQNLRMGTASGCHHRRLSKDHHKAKAICDTLTR